jgi:hypothetical protein
MCILLLLWLLARYAPLATCYLIQALTCLGLAAAVLSGEHPMLTCALHVVLASTYVTIAAAHAPTLIRWLLAGRRDTGQTTDPARHEA